MIVYRLCKSKYCRDLSGRGAEQSGGRWNSKGAALIYTSESRALCLAELAVHLPISILPVDYSIISIEFPSTSILEISPAELPNGWKTFPHSDFTQKIGDRFINEHKYLCLKVPSAVVKGDHNYLINPAHKEFNKVKIIATEPFEFDERLFK